MSSKSYLLQLIFFVEWLNEQNKMIFFELLEIEIEIEEKIVRGKKGKLC